MKRLIICSSILFNMNLFAMNYENGMKCIENNQDIKDSVKQIHSVVNENLVWSFISKTSDLVESSSNCKEVTRNISDYYNKLKKSTDQINSIIDNMTAKPVQGGMKFEDVWECDLDTSIYYKQGDIIELALKDEASSNFNENLHTIIAASVTNCNDYLKKENKLASQLIKVSKTLYNDIVDQ